MLARWRRLITRPVDEETVTAPDQKRTPDVDDVGALPCRGFPQPTPDRVAMAPAPNQSPDRRAFTSKRSVPVPGHARATERLIRPSETVAADEQRPYRGRALIAPPTPSLIDRCDTSTSSAHFHFREPARTPGIVHASLRRSCGGCDACWSCARPAAELVGGPLCGGTPG